MKFTNKTKISFELSGQCASGKNNMIITRSGKRFPNKRFSDWKVSAILQLRETLKQVPKKVLTPINYPISVDVHYWAGDKRRRDVPGMIDALWHLIEYADLVTDDQFLGGWEQVTRFHNRGIDKDNPRVVVELFVDEQNKYKESEDIRTRGLMKKDKTRRKKIC